VLDLVDGRVPGVQLDRPDLDQAEQAGSPYRDAGLSVTYKPH
jgi:hypothetical protein